MKREADPPATNGGAGVGSPGSAINESELKKPRQEIKQVVKIENAEVGSQEGVSYDDSSDFASQDGARGK